MYPIIRKLGGIYHVAKLCDVTPDAVRNWHYRGNISSPAMLVLMHECDSKGIAYCATDFELYYPPMEETEWRK